MSFKDLKGAAAIEVFAEIMEPLGEILDDSELVAIIDNKEISNKKKASLLLKKKPGEIHRILCILDGKDPDKEELPLIRIPVLLLEILNDAEIISLFTSPQPGGGEESSGGVSANTEE